MTTTTGQAAAPGVLLRLTPQAPGAPGTGERGSHLYRHAEAALGTVFTFAVASFDDPAGRAAVADAVASACAVLHRVDSAWQPYRPDSLLARIRGGQQVDPELDDPDGALGLDAVLRRCAAAQRLTKGGFDAWRGPDGFDPSGVVRGWAVERAVALLEAAGFHDLVLGGGGDVTVRGSAPGGEGWAVGLRDPRDDECELGSVLINGRGAVASTGAPAAGAAAATGLVGVTVVGPELGWCDVIASALLAGGDVEPAWLATVPTYRALGIDASGRPSGGLVEELRVATEE